MSTHARLRPGLLALIVTLTPVATAQPGDCNGLGVQISVVPTIDGTPITQPVVPGEPIEYRIDLCTPPDFPPVFFCDVTGGQLSVTLPDWTTIPPGGLPASGKLVEVAGYPGLPAVPLFDAGQPFQVFVPGYVAEAADADAEGFLKLHVDYGQTAFLASHGVVQANGTYLGNPPEASASSETSHALPILLPGISIDVMVDADLVCQPTPVTAIWIIANDGEADLADVTFIASHCSDITGPAGDDGDGILSTDEQWTFTCTPVISTTTLMTATVVAVAIGSSGAAVTDVTYTDEAFAVVEAELCNDGCAGALPVSGGETPFTNLGATDFEIDGCLLGADVWFEYVAPADGVVTFDAFGGSDLLPVGELFEGCACPPSGPFVCFGGPGGPVEYVVTAGACYTIRLGGFLGTQGNGVLLVVETGACCLSPEKCLVLSRTACGSLGGDFVGPGTFCGDPLGACCFPNGNCEQFGEEACNDQAGMFAGPGTACLACYPADCNGNGIDDTIDIIDGASTDGDGNGVPDECQGDGISTQINGLELGATTVIDPGGGGSTDPRVTPLVEITNVSGGPGQTVSAAELTTDQHPGAGGYAAFDTQMQVFTSMDDGQFFMRLSIPFDVGDLGGGDPLATDLVYFDEAAVAWTLAVAANTAPSPGHAGPIGDRFVASGPVPPTLSDDLGDYGVYWEAQEGLGFVWANVDHATDFAAALPPCAADVDLSGAVDVADLVAVILAWGPGAGPADVDGNGTVNVADLVAVIVAWGPC